MRYRIFVRLMSLSLAAMLGIKLASAQEPPLVIAYIPISPYAQLNANGERSGFLIELARQIGEEISVEIDLLDVSNSREFIGTQIEGQTQMIAGVARLPPLQATNVFSDPVASESLRLVVLSENAQSFSDPVQGMRIGVVPPAVGSQVEELLAQNERMEFPTPEAAMMDLITGDLDAILLPNPAAVSISRAAKIDDRISFVGKNLREFERVIALHESRAHLLPAINDAIAKMEDDGRLAELRRRYFIDIPASQPDVMSVGIADAPPYGIVAEDGTISGFAAELFSDLAERAGLRFDFQALPPDADFTSLTNGEADILPFVFTSSNVHSDVDVTLPVRVDPVALYVRPGAGYQSWNDLIGQRIGVKSNVYAAAIDVGFQSSDIEVIDDDIALMNSLLGGEVEAIIDVSTLIEAALKASEQADGLQLLDDNLFTLKSAIGLRFGLGAAREQLNAVIPAYILSDRFSDLQTQYFGEPVFWTPIRIYSALAAVAAIFLALFGYSLWQRQRYRRLEFVRQQADLAREKAHSQTLEKLVSELELSNRQQAEFTYAISHDLKSPTNTIGMLIEELAEVGAVGDGGHDILSDMKATNGRMRQLVDDVLDYSRIVEEEMVLEPMDLNVLINEIIEDLASEISKSETRITPIELPVIHGHRMQIRTLFQNLISNAVKFRSPDRDSIIQITCQKQDQGTVVSVVDNGIGVPEGQREKIFGLFKRLHVRSAYQGVGLGLAICRRVMANHDGTISCRSGLDGGTAFDLLFRTN